MFSNKNKVSKKDKLQSLFKLVEVFLPNKEQVKYSEKTINERKYEIISIKINTSNRYLHFDTCIKILGSIKIIVKNICEMFEIDSNKLKIVLLSANPGCFNINIGIINIPNSEFYLAKIEKSKIDLFSSLIKFLTGKNIESYNNKPTSLIKDCLVGYLTKKIPENNSKLKYMDIKSSKNAKKIIYKEIKNLPNFKSVNFGGIDVTGDQIDIIF